MNKPISKTMLKHLETLPDKTALSCSFCYKTACWTKEFLNIALADNEKVLTQKYEIFDGIEASYNYFLTENFYHRHSHMPAVIEINHCRHGRIGWQMENNQNLYLGEGDLSLHMKDNCAKSYISLPLGFYEGFSLSIDFNKLLKNIPDILKDANLDFKRLQDIFCDTKKTTALPAGTHIEHIFSELYDLPENLIVPYCKLKSQEFIMFLSQLSINEIPVLDPSDSAHVKLVKEIHSLLISNLQKRYTIEELSRQYLINTSSLKTAFKAVYGVPIATYMKQYRMSYAATLIRDTQQSISEISSAVGYSNQSKFTTAFKNVIGVLPSVYRQDNR